MFLGDGELCIIVGSRYHSRITKIIRSGRSDGRTGCNNAHNSNVTTEMMLVVVALIVVTIEEVDFETSDLR